jgi:hypothetical protein
MVDAYGNTAAGYSGTIRFASTDAQATLPSNYTFMAADAGVHMFAVTFKTAGTQTVSATDTVTASITGTSNATGVAAAAASRMTVSAPASVSVNAAFNITVTLFDPFGNVATGYLHKVHLTSSDPKALLPSDYTFTAADAGIHVFSIVLRSKGNRTITVQDMVASSLLATSASINVR